MSTDASDPDGGATVPTDGYDNVPRELRERDQWLLWDASAETSRRPHWNGDFGISWSDPREWHTFEEAVRAAQNRESWGIGYVTAADNDDHTPGVYGCIDIDGAYTDDGSLKDWVPDLDRLTDASTYIERSPSGDGLHIPIVGSEVPEWWSDSQIADHEGVDVLTNKFCTFTGDTIPQSGTGIASVDPTPWLLEAYSNINGEAPRLGDTAGARSGEYDGDEYLEASDIENALDHIDPDLPHTEWIRLAYAVHDFDSGSKGKQIFERWSKQGDKWDTDAEESIDTVWSGATEGSGVTLATLIHKAKANGWDMPTPDTGASRSKAGGSTQDTPLSDAVDGSWFDTDRCIVNVQDTAEYDSGELADLFRDPDDLPADAIMSIIETPGGDEYLDDSSDWRIRERAPSDPFADMSVHQLKNEALAKIPVGRIAYVPKREEWFWCDDDGVWNRHGQEDIRQWLDDYLGDHYRRQVRNEVQDQLKARVRSREEAFGGGPPGTIATQSGLVDLETGKCRPIEPEDKVRWRLGVEYDPDAECPKWREFLGNVAEPSDIPMLQEYVGYCLHHWDLPFKKALIIFGPTDAGKSVFLDVIRALFGGDESPATSSTSIQYLANERWGPARLVNTAINIRNDLDSSTIENTGKLKELIAGDALDAERKRKPVFKFSPTAKHIFAANRAPDRSVDDEAFWNRWLTVMFPQSVPRSEQDPQLTDDLIAELPGILNWAIEGHNRLMEQKRFTNEPLPFENRDKWERYGNSIEQFTDRHTETEPGAVTPKRTTDAGSLGVYDSYVAYARQNGLECETLQKFTSELTRREGVSQARRTVDGERPRCYIGLELTDDAPRSQHQPSDGDDDGPVGTGLNSSGGAP